MYFYNPSTRGKKHTDTYVFISSKFKLPKNAVADQATKALEEFTATMKAKQNCDITCIDKSINNAIGVLSNLLKSTTQVAATNNATRLRVLEVEAQLPRVDNNNHNNYVQPPRVNTNTNNDVQPSRVNNNTNDNVRPPRVLRQRATIHQQKYL